jgi:hypothetical protein
MAKKEDKKSKPSGDGKLIGLAGHRRAAPAIRRAKAIGGLAGFLLAAFIGYSHGAPFAETMERAVVVGIGANLAAWAAAMLIWKRVLVAEAHGVAARLRDGAATTADKP